MLAGFLGKGAASFYCRQSEKFQLEQDIINLLRSQNEHSNVSNVKRKNELPTESRDCYLWSSHCKHEHSHR